MKKEQNFERALPEGYKQAFYINAKEKKLGITLNLIAIAVLALVMGIAFLTLRLTGKLSFEILNVRVIALLLAYLVFFVSMFGYIILHELVHGAVYKALTGEKLTFGMSWSCAFCGVPNIYVYRKASLISSAAPLVVFSIILGALTAVLYFVSPWYYILSAFIFGLHLGGCSGDMYVILLLLFKFKDETTLIRDTGPEQSFYVKVEK
jgi:hypothetical protein